MESSIPTENEKILSKQDALTLVEYCHETISINRLKDFKSLVLRLKKLFEFNHVFCGYGNIVDWSKKKNPNVEIINISYPQELLDNYFETGLNMKDPIAEKALEIKAPLNWKEWLNMSNAKEILQDMEFRGIEDGYTYCHFDVDIIHSSIFSFICPKQDDTERIKKILYYVVPHLSSILKRLLGNMMINNVHLKSRLTSREMEALNWLKLGKTSWEISRILEISERTVNFHINNIIDKLNVSNRTHAVALAGSLGIIGCSTSQATSTPK